MLQRLAAAAPVEAGRMKAYCIYIVDTEGPMRVTVKKWGNSASVRIPSPILEAAQLQLDQQVDIREEQGCIIIEPVRGPAYDLAALIAGITDENRHAEIESGGPVGAEVL